MNYRINSPYRVDARVSARRNNVSMGKCARTPTPGTLTLNPVTGHYYQVFGDNSITWPAAQTFVISLPCLSLTEWLTQGLARLNVRVPTRYCPIWRQSRVSHEDEFVECTSSWCRDPEGTDAFPQRNLDRWGTRLPAATVGENWTWVNSEGAISGQSGATAVLLELVKCREPNDNTATKRKLTWQILVFGNFGWNDEGALGYHRWSISPNGMCHSMPQPA